MAESALNALVRIGVFPTNSKLLVVTARGLLIVTVIALIVLLVFEPGAESVGRESSTDAEQGARSQRRSREERAHDRPTANSSYANKRGVWVKPGQKRNVPVGRISIPAIDINAPYRLGAHDDIIQLGPGLWPATPFPGKPGNAVFAGHRTTYTHPFGDLDLLREGDRIHTTIQGRQHTVFSVFRTTIVPEAAYADFVLDQPEHPEVRMITLFACTPKGSRSHRIVVQAKASRPDSTKSY